MKVLLQRCLLPALAQQRKQHQHRLFHSTRRRDVVKPFLLADIGEGIRECQIIQWFVQPGARVEQFDKVCEVQSDKAAVEITSPYDGVIRELHYEADDMALVGKPLLDIDIYNDISAEDGSGLADTGGGIQNAAAQVNVNDQGQTQGAEQASEGGSLEREEISGPLGKKREKLAEHASSPFTYHQSLATPAVRHLLKSHNITITDITGTGKDGRVLKDDVHDHISKTASMQPQAPKTTTFTTSTPTPLTPIQAAMFKTMTASLSIPHFLYTTPVHLTPLNHLRARTNPLRPPDQKLSTLPFILKAVSQAFSTHPLLNASLSTTDAHKPTLSYNSSHDFGIAVDTPFGLLVPVVRGVQSLSVAEISAAIKHLSAKAREGKLAKGEMSGATFTVSNIGAVGGGVVAPVIVGPQVAILGVGRARVVPAWDEGLGTWVKRDEAVLSWSADHRVVDGAECARAAEKVCALVENVEAWGVDLR